MAWPAAAEVPRADVVILGEVHDNPAHHAWQAEVVADLAPTALVFEMLLPEQAAAVTPEVRPDAEALEAALGWEVRGWPDFAMYHPIFTAAPQAAVVGADVPREAVRAAMEAGAAAQFAAVFDEDPAPFGLDVALPAGQQSAREAMQARAHCDALPEALLPGMVEAQRLRDAALARAALRAHADHGGPVVVITGNGHARSDWGVPSMLALAAPDLSVFAAGQLEQAAGPDSPFDLVRVTAPADRDDPCAAFH
nr:ChaN family lipoprotein [Rhodobaculum claviforme]